MNTTKVCSSCKKEKLLSDFCKNKRTKDGFHYYCKGCRTIKHKESWVKQESKHKDARLKRMYGISLDDFNDMFELQKGVCKICGSEGKAKGLAVDHCHNTGKVRGLLCISCNTMLGKMERNTNLISNICNYLSE